MKNPIKIPCACGRKWILAKDRSVVVGCGTYDCEAKALRQVARRRARAAR